MRKNRYYRPMRVLPLLVAVSASAFAQTVDGSVTNAATAAPLAGVQVTLASPKHSYKSTTDARGAFRIDNVAPGDYSPKYDLRGFLHSSRGESPLRVSAADATVHLSAAMIQMGRISGRILDADNGPLPGANASLSCPESITSVSSDKDGVFTFDQVPPGPYTLDALPPDVYKEPPAASGQRLGYARTYYPGTLVRSGAARIDIRPGADVLGADIKLLVGPVYRMRGRVLDPRGEPMPHAAVTLGEAADFFHREQKITSGEDGSFQFARLTEGDWRLYAEANADGIPVKAFRSVSVGGRDIEGVELRLSAPFAIHGLVSMEAPDGKPAEQRPPMVVLGPVGASSIVQARPDASGAFTANGIYPGAYNVLPVSPGAPFYLASIRLGDRDATDGRIELYSGALPLTVVYKSDGGTVRGTVEHCADATVVLTPQNPDLRRRPEFIRRARCAADGRYELTAVRPGEYYALALHPDDPAFSFLLIDLDQHLVNQASRVSVQPNQATLTDLKVVASQ
jgi:hypothetical protein